MFIAVLAVVAIACMGRRRAHHHNEMEQPQSGATEFRQRATTSMRERFEEWHRTQHEGPNDEPATTPDDNNTPADA